MEDNTTQLKAISANVGKNVYSFDKPNKALIECFVTPPSAARSSLVITVETSEFTCLCPITGQPDWATISVQYQPAKYCLESKSFKLYLMGYRNLGAFHEAVVTMIGNDLVSALDPKWLTAKGEFSARGGISFQPQFMYRA